MLKEIQVTQTLDLRVVYRMLTGNSSIGNRAARDEVNGNGELMLSGIKVNTLNVPRRGYSKSGFKQLIRHASFVLRGWLPKNGFLDSEGNAKGRPVGVAVDKNGALLVADDVGNAIWRVTPAKRVTP